MASEKTTIPSAWRNLPTGAWFFLDSPDCLERYSVQERTSGGYSIVCSTPYHHEGAKRDMLEIVAAHNLGVVKSEGTKNGQ